MNDAFTNVRLQGLKEQLTGVTYNGSIVTNEYYNYLIRKGECYYAENVFPILNGATSYIVFDATDVTKELVAFPTVWCTTVGYQLISLGTCESYVGGTEIPVINRNFNFNHNQVKMLFAPTITNGVFPTYPTILVGGKSTNQSSGAGAIGTSDLIILLQTGLIYVFKIVNHAGEKVQLYNNFLWFERE